MPGVLAGLGALWCQPRNAGLDPALQAVGIELPSPGHCHWPVLCTDTHEVYSSEHGSEQGMTKQTLCYPFIGTGHIHYLQCPVADPALSPLIPDTHEFGSWKPKDPTYLVSLWNLTQKHRSLIAYART